MYQYKVIEERILNNDIGSYTSYGIKVLESNVEVKRISDISTNFESVYELAELCTRAQLCLIHLEDVVEDWLS